VFEHISVLLSFVYALALTHLLSSATELMIARRRVRFSGLYAVWAVNAAALLMSNWVALYTLTLSRNGLRSRLRSSSSSPSFNTLRAQHSV
jgi:hypothetical protein